MISSSSEQGEALLAAVRADPSDDLPRLAYADWLEETGADPERAEFIRLQVAKELGPAFHGFLCLPERLCAGCRRENQMLSIGGYVFDWIGACIPLAGSPATWHAGGGTCVLYHDHPSDSRWAVTFRRGFVAEVRCTLALWHDRGAAVLAAHPVTRVELTNRSTGTSSDPYWYWTYSHDDERDWSAPSAHNLLPRAVFDLLANAASLPAGFKGYASREAAIDALSDALILWRQTGGRRPSESRPVGPYTTHKS